MTDAVEFAPWVSEEAAAMYRAEAAKPAALAEDVVALRAHYDDFNRRHLATAHEHYSVETSEQRIAGIRVDVVTPSNVNVGHRTLLCLHGGAFMWGRGAGALLEAVPVAATANVRVIAIEYALAPEATFPTAVDDVVAVYRDLCATHAPESIGLYGCSAGGILSAQAIARMIKDQLPLPGAVAMLCGTGLEMFGDSVACAGRLNERGAGAAPVLADLPYFGGVDPADPLVFPGNHDEVLARFPPSLLVTGTRDFAASSVTVMHRRLIAAGRTAELLHFDGMWHAFHMATALPESRETFAAMGRFFDKHLA